MKLNNISLLLTIFLPGLSLAVGPQAAFILKKPGYTVGYIMDLIPNNIGNIKLTVLTVPRGVPMSEINSNYQGDFVFQPRWFPESVLNKELGFHPGDCISVTQDSNNVVTIAHLSKEEKALFLAAVQTGREKKFGHSSDMKFLGTSIVDGEKYDFYQNGMAIDVSYHGLNGSIYRVQELQDLPLKFRDGFLDLL